MEPGTELTPAPPTPVVATDDPVLAPVVANVTEIMDRAYLEAVSRTRPDIFMKFAAQVLAMRSPRTGDRQQTVVNVVNAIPRSPLDGLPPGFTYK
jgi:hypothetical protein